MKTPLICMTLTGTTLEEDLLLAKKYEKQTDIVELRVDYLKEEEQLYVRRFPALIKQPCLLTIRRDIDGGKFNGSEFSRTNLFGRALAFANTDKTRNFAYVDFEEDYQVPGIQDSAQAFGVKIIRSYHNMTGPVKNLKERCNQMRKTGFEIPKIAFMPTNLSDVTNLFYEGQLIDYDHILVAMGPEGQPSRILSAFSDSYLTYVSPQELLKNTNAIGQTDPVELSELYHFKEITKHTNLYGITGWPLLKTSSPQIHNSGYKRQGVDAVYLPMRSKNISDALFFAEKMGVAGLSVTIPHKESVLYYLHEESQSVEQIGACNTIVRKNNKWLGYNTDAPGFKRALVEFTTGQKLKRMKVAVIGAGGAAKAIVYVLKQLGCRVCIFNRTLENARKLAEKYGFEYCQLEPKSINILSEYSSLIIQTTSVGMNSEEPSSEENDPIYFYDFQGKEMIFDIVYVPAKTPVMKRAEKAGCKTCNGYKMLEYQGFEQYKLFTGKNYEE